MIAVTTINILVNMAVMGHASLKRLKLLLTKLLVKFKAWRMKKAKKEDIYQIKHQA
jgi:hypothetical protein